MNSHNQTMMQTLDVLLETIGILKAALSDQDDDKAHEGVSVLLMQCMSLLGLDSPVIQHFFSVMDAIKRRIDTEDLDRGGLEQTLIFERQPNEIKALAPKA
jgi:hypothetical protein